MGTDPILSVTEHIGNRTTRYRNELSINFLGTEEKTNMTKKLCGLRTTESNGTENLRRAANILKYGLCREPNARLGSECLIYNLFQKQIEITAEVGY